MFECALCTTSAQTQMTWKTRKNCCFNFLFNSLVRYAHFEHFELSVQCTMLNLRTFWNLSYSDNIYIVIKAHNIQTKVLQRKFTWKTQISKLSLRTVHQMLCRSHIKDWNLANRIKKMKKTHPMFSFQRYSMYWWLRLRIYVSNKTLDATFLDWECFNKAKIP
jgi:hypothetical protein